MSKVSGLTTVTHHLRGWKAQWYQTEVNTATLIRSILKRRQVKSLTGEDIWNLIRLTWITSNGHEVVTDGWKRLKLPALAKLFERPMPSQNLDLATTMSALNLPNDARMAASVETGIVNFRSVWRNSSLNWCIENQNELREILSDVIALKGNDQGRFELARRIDSLGRVASPNGTTTVGAVSLLSHLLACADPYRRFPIINGRDGVKALLRSRDLQSGDLERQFKG